MILSTAGVMPAARAGTSLLGPGSPGCGGCDVATSSITVTLAFGSMSVAELVYMDTPGNASSTASIPAGTEHAYTGDGHYTKVLTMSTPGGLERLVAAAGRATEEHVFGTDVAVDLDGLREAAAELDVTFV